MQALSRLTDRELSALRQRVSELLSPTRFAHTLAVEDEAARIAEHLIPERINEVRASAILHDLTKELPLAEHLRICRAHGIDCSGEACSVAVLHGLTAAAMIVERFPEFATDGVLSAVRRHTVGDASMSVLDKILFLADYIEPTRPYPACISLRESFWTSFVNSAPEERTAVLDRAVFTEIKHTLSHLIEKGAVIAPASLDVYNAYAKRKDWQG